MIFCVYKIKPHTYLAWGSTLKKKLALAKKKLE